MSRVFISYAHANAEFATRLAQDLAAAGFDYWMDVRGLQGGLQPGTRWANNIQEALEKCAAVVLILSPQSVESSAVENEWSYALDIRKPLFPIRHLECKIPFRLRPHQYIDFVPGYDEGLSRLKEAVGEALQPPDVLLNVAEEDLRWIDKLQKALNELLTYDLQRTVRIAASPFSSPGDVALFVAVVSRAWLECEATQLEVSKFRMRQTDLQARRLRQFKVLIEPLEAAEGEPQGASATTADPLPDLDTLRFFFDPDDPRTRTTELEALALEVSKRLRALSETKTEPPSQSRPDDPVPDDRPAEASEEDAGAVLTGMEGNGKATTGTPKGTVFLAQASPGVRDIAGDLNSVRRELARRSYLVVPGEGPKGDKEQVESEARAAMGDVDLSIHLFGAEYGQSLGTDWRSVSQLQFEIAGELCERGELRRLVWISSAAGEPGDPRQRDLHAAVRTAAEGTEWFEGQPLEAFKDVIVKRLGELEREKKRQEPEKGLGPGARVYLIYDLADEKVALKLYTELQENGILVLTPLFDATPDQIEAVHEKNLRQCDAALVVFGEAPAMWWKLLLPDLPVTAHGKPRGHYLADPATPEKEVFDDPDAVEIKAWKDASIRQFIEQIRAARSGE